MQPLNASQNGEPGSLRILHKLLGAEAALSSYTSKCKKDAAAINYTDLQNKCRWQCLLLEYNVNKLAELLASTAFSMDDIKAFVSGGDMLEKQERFLKQKDAFEILMEFHSMIINMIKTEILPCSYTNTADILVPQLLVVHQNVEKCLREYV